MIFAYDVMGMALAFSKGYVFDVHTNAIHNGEFLTHVATSIDVIHRVRAK